MKRNPAGETCPTCGVRVRDLPPLTEAVALRPPTEDVCWRQFWEHLAVIWVGLPPEVQQRCLDRVASNRG